LGYAVIKCYFLLLGSSLLMEITFDYEQGLQNLYAIPLEPFQRPFLSNCTSTVPYFFASPKSHSIMFGIMDFDFFSGKLAMSYIILSPFACYKKILRYDYDMNDRRTIHCAAR
jgi:hypothetical protein